MQVNWEEIILRYKRSIIVGLIGCLFLGFGILSFNKESFKSNDIEIVTSEKAGNTIKVEIAGSVNSPGVYSFDSEGRVEDVITMAGGLSGDANIEWVSKFLNKAAYLSDGQKIYIPSINEQTTAMSATLGVGDQSTSGTQNGDSSKIVNINTASQKELEALSGIGPVTAQNVIEHRPYSSLEELVSRDILKKNVFEKIRDQLTLY